MSNLEPGQHYKVEIEQYADAESPHEMDGTWTLYTFSSKYNSYKNPEDLGIAGSRRGRPPVITNPGLRRKMKVGLAFFVSCYSHSGDSWSLAGEGHYCQWDSTQWAGILIWENKPEDMGAKTYEDRKADARNDLEQYSAWANGNTFAYSTSIVDEDGEEVEHVSSCCGFIVANGRDEDYLWGEALDCVPLDAPVECVSDILDDDPDGVVDGGGEYPMRVLRKTEKRGMALEAGFSFKDDTPIGVVEDFLKENGLLVM